MFYTVLILPPCWLILGDASFCSQEDYMNVKLHQPRELINSFITSLAPCSFLHCTHCSYLTSLLVAVCIVSTLEQELFFYLFLNGNSNLEANIQETATSVSHLMNLCCMDSYSLSPLRYCCYCDKGVAWLLMLLNWEMAWSSDEKLFTLKIWSIDSYLWCKCRPVCFSFFFLFVCEVGEFG